LVPDVETFEEEQLESAEQVLFRNLANNPNHVFAYTKDDNHASLFDDFEPECLDPIWQKSRQISISSGLLRLKVNQSIKTHFYSATRRVRIVGFIISRLVIAWGVRSQLYPHHGSAPKRTLPKFGQKLSGYGKSGFWCSIAPMSKTNQRTKHEVDRMTCCGDIAIRNFPRWRRTEQDGWTDGR